MRELAGRFSIVSRTEDAIIVGCLGNLQASLLSDEEIHYIAAFYIDGNFVINGTNVLKETDRIIGMKLPKGNFKGGYIRICYYKEA